jgi:hypothetical protein
MAALGKSAAPSGVTMMLKALGVNPEMFKQMADGVQAVVDALQRIEKKQDEILSRLAQFEGKDKP